MEENKTILIDDIYQIGTALIRSSLRQHIDRYQYILQTENYSDRENINCSRRSHRYDNTSKDRPVRSILQLGCFDHFPWHGNHRCQHHDQVITKYFPANDSTDKQKAAWEFIKYIESPEALAKWSTGTGYLPPRKGVADDPNGFKKMIEENKNIQVALSTMPNLVKWASFPGANGLQAEQLLIDARDIILSGKETAAQALHETAEKINNLL